MIEKLQPVGQPGHKRSALWRYEGEIRRLIAEGWTYQQIADALKTAGLAVTVRALRDWALLNIGRRRGVVKSPPQAPTPPVVAPAPPTEKAKPKPRFNFSNPIADPTDDPEGS